MVSANEIKERWNQMTPEEFALIKREDLREDVRGLYDIEINRRQSLGQHDSPFSADSMSSSESIPLASLGDRLAGQLLDSLFAGGTLLLVLILGSSLSTLSERLGDSVMTVAIVFPLAYLLLADGLGKGQSYGKRVMRTAVVDASNRMPCTFWKSFIRNLPMFLGVIDWIFIFGRNRQRLGDKVAKTIVLKIGSS